MTRVLLARHGEVDFDGSRIFGRSMGTELNALGSAQSATLGDHLRAERIKPDIVITSGARRATSTVCRAMMRAGLIRDLVVDPRFLEMSQGFFEGKKKDDVYIDPVVAAIHAQTFDFRLPGGESVNDVAARAKEAVIELAATFPDATILVGTHGLAKRCLVGKELGWTHSQITRPEPQTDTPNASLTELYVSPSLEIEVVEFAKDIAAA